MPFSKCSNPWWHKKYSISKNIRQLSFIDKVFCAKKQKAENFEFVRRTFPPSQIFLLVLLKLSFWCFRLVQINPLCRHMSVHHPDKCQTDYCCNNADRQYFHPAFKSIIQTRKPKRHQIGRNMYNHRCLQRTILLINISKQYPCDKSIDSLNNICLLYTSRCV